MDELTCEGIEAGYRGHPVLQGVSLALGRGMHLLLGPNGAGKTTLFRVLAGVLPPWRGQVRVVGRDPHREPAAKQAIGLSAHRVPSAPRLSVADNLQYWARLYELDAATRARRVEASLALFELEAIAGQRAAALSRGQSQRLGLARALLADPPVLLLDEPLAGVDPAAAAQLLAHLRRLAEEGRTLLMSTHDLADAARLGGDVAILHQGRILVQGDAAALREHLMGRAYRLRLRARGPVRQVLAQVGHVCHDSGDGSWEVEVAGRTSAEALVSHLAAPGLAISEVAPVSHPLQDLYLHLADSGGVAVPRTPTPEKPPPGPSNPSPPPPARGSLDE